MRSFLLMVVGVVTLYFVVPLLVHFTLQWLPGEFSRSTQTAIVIGSVILVHMGFRKVFKDHMPRV